MAKLNLFLEKHLYFLFAVVLSGVCLYQWCFPEFIQEEHGLGWDGEAYARIIKNFELYLTAHKINAYYIQRIFPIALVFSFLQISGLSVTDTHIIQVFLGLNIALIFISFLVWILLCRKLQLATQGKILSFTGLFLNYALLKMPFYYPVLTDLLAFTLGLIMLYCFLQNSSRGLILTSVIGAFSFPTLFYCGMVLYVLPLSYNTNSGVKIHPSWNKWIAALGMAIFVCIFLVARFIKDKPYINPADSFIFTISFALALAYIYTIIYIVAKPELYFQALLSVKVWYRAGIALILLMLLMGITWYVAAPEEPILNYKGFLANVVIEAIANPLVFLVAHFIYFGPVFLLLLYFRKEFTSEMNKYGTGLHLFILIYLLVGAGSESRQFINAWPVCVLLLCSALKKYKFSTLFLLVMMGTALLTSKFWYRMNREAFRGDFLDFPYQHYFMSQGPWMSDTMYLLQGSMGLAVFGMLYFLFLRKGNYKVTQQEP